MNGEYLYKQMEQIEKNHLADRKKIRTLVSAVRILKKRVKNLESRPARPAWDGRLQ